MRYRPGIKFIGVMLTVIMVFTMMPLSATSSFAVEKQMGVTEEQIPEPTAEYLPTGGVYEPKTIWQEPQEIRESPEISLKKNNTKGYSLKSSDEKEDPSQTIYNTPEEAVDGLRRQLRQNTDDGTGVNATFRISLSYWGKDLSSVQKWNDFLESGEYAKYDGVGRTVFAKAMSYTGDPEEGDWIMYRRSMIHSYSGIPVDNDLTEPYMEWRFTTFYFTNKTQDDETDKMLADILENLDLKGKSDYEKVRSIYGWICNNVEYDFLNLDNDSYFLKYTAYAALKNRTAVCQGYATLLYRMCLEEGLDCRIISGDGHAWNAVRLGNHWYYLDCTWDAGRNESEYRYFLCGKSDFENHRAENVTSIRTDWPDDVDYQYADPKWFQKYNVSNAGYSSDSQDPQPVPSTPEVDPHKPSGAVKIIKRTNRLKVKGKTASIKYSKLKKKSQTLKVSKVIRVTGKGQGKTTWSISSVKKGKKSFRKYIKINAKTGKVTVKKGLRKGTYKVKGKVRAAGNKYYKPITRTVTFKIKVR